MHIVDRMACAHLQSMRHEVFMDRFVEVVGNEVLVQLNREIAREDFVEFASCLIETYNRRQAQYGAYKALMGKPGEPLTGTLYWEFSKVLLEYMDNVNVVHVTLLNVLGADLVKMFLDVTKLKVVLCDSAGGWFADQWRKLSRAQN